MKSQLYIPNKIKVGFNTRKDTYTGKLGYIIYHDGKVWRKEGSWESWREKYQDAESLEKEKRQQFEAQIVRYKSHNYYTQAEIDKFVGSYDTFSPYLGKFSSDKTIEPVEFENVPTEGFVLNKKAGGYSSGWNARATYCRVYDPRGFEFEISIPNLLYILQESNAYKGKGLEGTFVYAWDGKDLVLLPTTAQEYISSQNFTKIQSGKVGAKDLIEGATYKDKKEKEYVYLGKFNWCEENYRDQATIKKNYVFHRLNNGKDEFLGVTSLTSFAQRTNDTPVSNYADLMDLYNRSRYSYLPNEIAVTPYDVRTEINGYYRSDEVFDETPVVAIGDNKYEVYSIGGVRGSDRSWSNNRYDIKNYYLKCNKIITIKNDGHLEIKTITPKTLTDLSKDAVSKMNLKIITINKNNKKLQLTF